MDIYIYVADKENSQYVTVQPENADTILTVKELLRQRMQPIPLATADCNLYYRSQLLEDDRTLQDYNIQKDSTLMCDVKATVTPTITTNNNTWAIVTTAVVAPLFLVSSVLLFWSWTKKRKPHKK